MVMFEDAVVARLWFVGTVKSEGSEWPSVLSDTKDAVEDGGRLIILSPIDDRSLRMGIVGGLKVSGVWPFLERK